MNKLLLSLRLFFQGAILSYVALFSWLRPTTYLASKVISPLTYMIFFVLLGTFATGRESAPFYIIGNAMQAVASSGIFGVTMSIGNDRQLGTLPYLFATPANRIVVFVGRAFVHVIDGMLGVVLMFLFGMILLGLDLSQANLLALSITILITAFSTSGLGLLMGSLSLITRNVTFVNNTVFYSLLVFSGANVDLDSLPAWGQAVSLVLPLNRGIVAARQIIAGGALAQVTPLLVGEVLIGLCYVLFGYFLFRWLEFQAKLYGTLEAI